MTSAKLLAVLVGSDQPDKQKQEQGSGQEQEQQEQLLLLILRPVEAYPTRAIPKLELYRTYTCKVHTLSLEPKTSFFRLKYIPTSYARPYKCVC